MNELTDFINSILKELKIKNIDNIAIEEARKIVYEINKFLYTNYEGIGKTFELDSEREYISEYHKFWERNCEKILNPKIDEEKCEKVADIFHEIFLKHKSAFYSLYSKEDLKDDEVCKVRYYTASQDFNGSRNF